jgi:Fic family protein
MHIHPLYDGNGRVARVLFNLILGRGKSNYIPMTELCHVARSGYVLSLREAFLFSEWEPIIVFYCKCIEIVHLRHIN